VKVQEVKMTRHVYKIIFSVFLSLFFLITSFFNVIFSEEFYHYEFLKNNISEEMNVSEKDLIEVYGSLIEYVKGSKDTLQVEVKVAGEKVEFFNQLEIDHMEDVKGLYILLKKIYFGIIIFMIIFFIMAVLRKISLRFIVTGQFIVTIFLSISLIFVTLNNFTENFIVFHRMLFSNDLWLLDPATDRMIVILPEIFFRNMGLFSFIFYFAMSFLFMVLSKILFKVMK